MSKLQDDLGLLDALKQQYRGEIAVAQANIKVYMANAAGIGEHPDVTGALDELIEKMSNAQEKLQAIEGLIGQESPPQPLNG